MALDPEIHERIARIERLIQTIEETAVPAVRDKARDLVQAILAHHGSGLARIMELAHDLGNEQLVQSLVRDDLVGSLLLLHGLHPLEPPIRVRQALDRLRPRLFVHGADVELLTVEGDMARLRLRVCNHGSPAAAAEIEMRKWIEEAICGAAPEITNIAFEETRPAGPGLVSLPIV